MATTRPHIRRIAPGALAICLLGVLGVIAPAAAAKQPGSSLVPAPASGATPPAAPQSESTPPAKPVARVAKPVAKATKPVADASKPVVDATKPVASKPVVDATKPVADASKPVADATKPVADATKPVVDATKPVADATKPVAGAAKPVVDGTMPLLGAPADVLAPTLHALPVLHADGSGLGDAPSIAGEPAAALPAPGLSGPSSFGQPAPARVLDESVSFGGVAREHAGSPFGHGAPWSALTVALATSSIAAAPAATDAGRSGSPVPSKTPPFSPTGGGAPSSGPGGSFFTLFSALLVLLALVAPGLRRRLEEASAFLRPTLFVCALERPG